MSELDELKVNGGFDARSLNQIKEGIDTRTCQELRASLLTGRTSREVALDLDRAISKDVVIKHAKGKCSCEHNAPVLEHTTGNQRGFWIQK